MEWPALDQANRQPARRTTKAKVTKVGKMDYFEGNMDPDPPNPHYRTQNKKKRPERVQLKLGEFIEQAKLQGEGRPPVDPSILMTLPKGMDNNGKNVWWEEISLSVVQKGAPPRVLTEPPTECVLSPSINLSLLRKGIQVDQAVMHRKECNGKPAARFFLCNNSRQKILQKPGTRAGYVHLSPIIIPPPRHTLATPSSSARA